MLELSTVIKELRNELTKSMESAAGEQLRFGLGPIELEVTMVVTHEAALNGKVKFWVVETGADAKASGAQTHRVKLVLNPEVNGGSPYIGGRGRKGED
ncbi:trypco2 family protein [Nonomuraea sp. LPB2021202275-12-8]|uniref:trypco2 family protein n=1 Tax=Nonomuraea sp. LPB2021202275-12-8 TaxID=3120159 RepID=UPI00300C9B75